MTFLCDTNIISELVRPQPNPGVLIWVKNLSFIKISVITLEEIHYGLTSKPNLKIQNWFDNFIKNDCQKLNDSSIDLKNLLHSISERVDNL